VRDQHVEVATARDPVREERGDQPQCREPHLGVAQLIRPVVIPARPAEPGNEDVVHRDDATM